MVAVDGGRLTHRTAVLEGGGKRGESGKQNGKRARIIKPRGFEVERRRRSGGGSRDEEAGQEKKKMLLERKWQGERDGEEERQSVSHKQG